MKPIYLTTEYISEGRLKADYDNGQGQSKYYIIEDDVNIPYDGIVFPANSVLDFRCGSFMHELTMNDHSKTEIKPLRNYSTIDLNGSTVYSPIYCIFPRSVIVSGFANSLVHADWFKDNTADEGEEVYINRAIIAACSPLDTLNSPQVTLECRRYQLKAPITFPTFENISGGAFYSNFKGFTFISPGELKLNTPANPELESSEYAAIDVNSHFVSLKINKICGYKYTPENPTQNRGSDPNRQTSEICGGIGINMVGSNFHVDIDVKLIRDVKIGILIAPTYKPDSNSQNNVWRPKDIGIQYTNIKFEYITEAKYGIYVDIYKGNYDDGSGTLYNWFNECQVIGGQIGGDTSEYGVYFADRPAKYDANHIGGQNSLRFEDIGFEGLSSLPLRLCNISGGKFLNLRMAESLPGIDEGDASAPWIELKNVEFSEISLRGILNPSHIKIVGDSICKCVIFNAWILDDPDWFTSSRFNRLAIMPLMTQEANTTLNPVLTAYSSISPYNMSNTIVVPKQSTVLDLQKANFNILDILPFNNKSARASRSDTEETIPGTGGGNYSRFYVLPRTLNVIMSPESKQMRLDLTGLSKFAPCLVDICLTSDGTKKLILRTTSNPSKLIDTSNPTEPTDTITLSEPGLYRLTLDPDLNIVISKA